MLIRRRATLIILPLALCIAAAIIASAARPPDLSSHPAVIAYYLRQRGIDARHVGLSQNWPESVNYYAYGHKIYPYNANLIITLGSGSEVPGRLECLDDQTNCQLYLVRLGIRGEQLPDVQQNVHQTWMEWIEARTGLRLGHP